VRSVWSARPTSARKGTACAQLTVLLARDFSRRSMYYPPDDVHRRYTQAACRHTLSCARDSSGRPFPPWCVFLRLRRESAARQKRRWVGWRSKSQELDSLSLCSVVRYHAPTAKEICRGKVRRGARRSKQAIMLPSPTASLQHLPR
jgi:hypothetical protein